MKQMRYRKFSVLFIIIIILFTGAGITYGMSSPNYTIESDVISAGGGSSSSTNYYIEHTTGQSSAIGDSSSSNYSNFAGYQDVLSGILADSDGDGILDDGDGSGIVGDNPCIGGNTTNCDDNCIDTPNADQSDIDSDGVGDVCDNCRLVANPDQRDTNSDEDDNTNKAGEQHYGNLCDPDFDNNGIVGLADINELRKYYGKTVPPAPANIDLDGNGIIGLSDVNILRQYYGRAPGPGIGD
jgi:hypothetical protein